ncbi:arginine deiminase [Mycoplasma putrefaciens]|uniref:Arginine deiminase n=1 Tax=Mycoplasma putrefaciens Mput9231 TaxID=1292033 RepID=M9WCB0_9MOLU|nr:arginine deiminase [Mycoplasma putrefaciens]AGJ90787.1 Arginine deiminase [Mycoplasma putrefaciens Mput9231]
MEKKLNVFSEIGTLKTVLVHRPGEEVENLTPELLEKLLFDDVPFKDVAIQEHDAFTKIMRDNGVEVLYIEKLASETLDQHPELREKFIDQFIFEGNIEAKYQDKYRDFISSLDNYRMIKKMIAGTKKLELGIDEGNKAYPFVADPLPNVLFQRDPFATVGHGITMNRMWSETRNRETIFPDLVFKHHNRFANQVPYYYQRDWKDQTIEGGDILVLNKETLIIGVTQRTTIKAVEKFSKELFADPESSYAKVIVLDLPKSRAFMHLDTVFTNIDYDKFIAHPLIFDHLDEFKIYEITKKETKEIKKTLIELLTDAVGREVQIIRCGGDDAVAAGREQWSDGTNVITLRPGKVIAYDRNWVTIDLLRKAGVEVLTIASSELSRGRGGPRCMTMPLWREDLQEIKRY